MKTVEVAPNIFIKPTVSDSIKEPAEIIDDLEGLPHRVVGGLHNLSVHDKITWANKKHSPLRIIERGTKREEIWFPSDRGKTPTYISLNSETGRVQSHQKFKIHLPAIEYMRRGAGDFGSGTVRIWYDEGAIHGFRNEIDRKHAIASVIYTIKPKDKQASDYIESIGFHHYYEDWQCGEWLKTQVNEVDIEFKNSELNDGVTQERALQWIKKHCKHGFFPFSENLFGDEEEEFMFIADICSS